MLPLFDKGIRGECTCVYAYDRNHCLIGGSINGWPVIWVDKKLQVMPLSEASFDNFDANTTLGEVCSLTECYGDIFAGGSEPYHDKSVATVWHNGEITHLEYYPEKSISSEVVEIMAYGSDIYVVTLEYFYNENSEFITNTILWKNGAPVRAYAGLQTTSFTVI